MDTHDPSTDTVAITPDTQITNKGELITPDVQYKNRREKRFMTFGKPQSSKVICTAKMLAKGCFGKPHGKMAFVTKLSADPHKWVEPSEVKPKKSKKKN